MYLECVTNWMCGVRGRDESGMTSALGSHSLTLLPQEAYQGSCPNKDSCLCRRNLEKSGSCNKCPTHCMSMGSFLLSLRRWRGLNRPLAGRQSKGTFPRIVSNRTLLKMRLDFTGHILEMKAINRFLQDCCHTEKGHARQHSQEVRKPQGS